MKNILKENKISEKEFIEILLDELINSERINEDEYKLAYQTCTFELIQNYCARDIKEVLKNLKNIDDIEIEDIIDYFGFDEKKLISYIKNYELE